MQPVTSPTSTERLIRTIVLTLLINTFAVWFLRDAYVGYPRENVTSLAGTLGVETDRQPYPILELTADDGKRIANEINKGRLATIESLNLGTPGIVHEDHAYFLGPGGHLRIHTNRGRLLEADWRDGIHTESDLLWQTWIGSTLAAVGLVFVAQLVRVLTTRVCLVDDGLKVRGKPLIPFQAMTRLRADRYPKTGRLEIDYQLNNRAGTVRLDRYIVKEFPTIIAGICERTGFANPIESTRE